MSKSIYDLLDAIRAKYIVKKDVGAAFEEACVYFLKNCPGWGNVLEDVCLWQNWEFCDGQDTGIDLVARDR
ncbi:hypothetical protein IJT10_07280, partial [bacterium]|nr:hypothetical protein [bacterium]